jgi:hypothetical protein
VRWMPMLAIAFLLVPACADEPVRAPTVDGAPGAAPSGPAPDPEGPTGTLPRLDPEHGPALAQGTAVALVDAGEAPHRELRYDFSAAPVGSPVGGTFTATHGATGAGSAGELLSAGGPTTVAAPTEVTVTEVDDAGVATVRFTYGRGEVTDPGGMSEPELHHLADAVGGLADAEVTYEVTDRGLTTLVGADLPEVGASGDAADVVVIAERVPAFIQPLPVEPVGTGAVWTVRSTARVGGVPVVHTVTVELLDRDGDVLELLFTIDDADGSDGATGPWSSAERGRPPVSTVALEGGGNVTARLDRPVPLGASKGLTVELVQDALGSEPGAPLERTIVWDASLETTG